MQWAKPLSKIPRRGGEEGSAGVKMDGPHLQALALARRARRRGSSVVFDRVKSYAPEDFEGLFSKQEMNTIEKIRSKLMAPEEANKKAKLSLSEKYWKSKVIFSHNI